MKAGEYRKVAKADKIVRVLWRDTGYKAWRCDDGYTYREWELRVLTEADRQARGNHLRKMNMQMDLIRDYVAWEAKQVRQ